MKQHFCSDEFKDKSTEQLLELYRNLPIKDFWKRLRIKNEIDYRVVERLMEYGCQEVHRHAHDLWLDTRFTMWNNDEGV